MPSPIEPQVSTLPISDRTDRKRCQAARTGLNGDTGKHDICQEHHLYDGGATENNGEYDF